MSLLADLRAANPSDLEEPPWTSFKRVMPTLVPNFELTKMEVHGNGRIALRAKSPMRNQGRYFIVLTMEGYGAGREDGRREVRVGASSYRDEADSLLYDRPFIGMVDPTPGAVAVWLAGLLLTEDPHSDSRTHLA